MDTMPKILIADSSSVMRTTIINALSEFGFTDFAEAENGDEACQIFTEQNPDLVIIDLSLPGKTGMEAIRDMKKHNPDLKLIVCSASSHKELVIESVKLGAADFILKPLKIERLIKAVTTLFN